MTMTVPKPWRLQPARPDDDLVADAIPAFHDNYIWAIHDHRHCVLVDPGEAAPALDFLAGHGLELSAILLTHHHQDHIGGVDTLLGRFQVPVFGPADPRMPAAVRTVSEGDPVSIAAPPLEFEVIETPGHTRSHIVFHGHGALFCGDTLFSSGCGRLFEGTPAQMQASLDKLAALPDATAIFCAHEYTADNCQFALAVEPGNPELEARIDEVSALRAAGRITLPTRLGQEKCVNPFLRTRTPAVIEAARRREPGLNDAPDTVFGAIRRWKDEFRA